MSENTQSNRASLQGTVVSDKMDKTVVVAVARLTHHPLYGRVMRRTAKHKAHDEANECRTGDQVVIEECRPLSRDKTWRVVKIVKRAK
jgi:small subunit ribosomal protein S17